MLKAKGAQVVLFKMKTERSNVEFPMWRKKVDDSLLNDLMTPIPNWLSNVWDLESFTSNSKKEDSSKVERPEIPNWTHYRFDVLPPSFGRIERLAIERLIIRMFATVLESTHGKGIKISNVFTLANKKIDS